MPPNNQESDTADDATQPASTDLSSGTSEPAGSVDPSQITSEPPGDESPVVMPQPGVPDLGEKIGHEVSQDLARRLGIDVSEVAIINSEPQEWPDSGLGCPAPGMNYLTVITPGFLINLEADGEIYAYHTDQTGNFVLCGQDGRPFTG